MMMSPTIAILLTLAFTNACTKSDDSDSPSKDPATSSPANPSLDWGKDPAAVPAPVDINSLQATPIGSSTADEPWIIHLTALRWVDPKTKIGWFVSYKVKFPNDKELVSQNKYEAEHGRPALDSDLSAESYCRSRKGQLPTQDQLSQALSNGLDDQLNIFRNMTGGLGIKEADGLWTNTPAPKGSPKEYCNPTQFIVAYDLKKREWNCTDFASLAGGVLPQAACMVGK